MVQTEFILIYLPVLILLLFLDPRVNNSTNTDFQLSSNTFYGARLDDQNRLSKYTGIY